MIRWYGVVVGLGLLVAAGTAPVGGEGSDAVRVMSFNVRLGVADDGPDSWAHRRALLVRTIQDFDPDLLGTQETWPFQAEYMASQLPDREYVGWPRQPGNDKDGEECGILFRASRFEKLDSGQLWLSETPDVPGSRSWDSSLPRVVTWVKLRDRVHPTAVLWFFNTHFDHRGSEARRRSALLLRKRLLALGSSAAWVVTGDFNCAEGSAPYRALVEGNNDLSVVDSYRATHRQRSEHEGTFNAFKGDQSGGRIDWILHSESFHTVSATIDHSSEEGRYPSDHFPVTAVLRWGD